MAERVRRDQVKCPECGSYGCPRVNGYTLTGVGERRIRTCGACGCRFGSIVYPDGRGERFDRILKGGGAKKT